MNLIETTNFSFSAVIGELEHRRDVYLWLSTFEGEIVERFVSRRGRSVWLKTFYPQFVPDKAPDGTEPSEKRVSAVFCVHYLADPSLRSAYLRWLIDQNE